MKKEINVVGAAFIENNQVLAAQRQHGKSLGGFWEFPGGKIEPGETPKAALIRELQEEFGDEIKVGEPVMETVTYEYDFGLVNLTVFYAELLTHHFSLVAHEQVKWVKKSNLKDLKWAPADWPIIEALSA